MSLIRTSILQMWPTDYKSHGYDTGTCAVCMVAPLAKNVKADDWILRLFCAIKTAFEEAKDREEEEIYPVESVLVT